MKEVGLEHVKAGFAWDYKKYQHEQSAEDRELYADAENTGLTYTRWFL